MANLLLGIDTGGTYTDGVLLDSSTREVIRTTKTLTTRYDLKDCILAALDGLLPGDPESIQLVAISTTLATNAIAEGKGRPVALFLLGYDPDLVRRFKFENSFATSNYYYFQGGHDLHGQAQGPLDLYGITEKANALKDDVEAFAVSGYFSPFNPSHEEQASDAITRSTGMPVILGHQLASKLNSVERATTATLNASLLSILQEFVGSMRAALDERGISAPLMVVRGDGALMSAAMSHHRPVETVHSGPAASAIGGRFLSGREEALVIDIGGTTTDIAVLDRGRVTIQDGGAQVGGYNTAVRAANIRSIGLGGDSLIGFDVEDRINVGPSRVVPISYLAHTDARVADDLQKLNYRTHQRPSPEHIEYWFLQREPRRYIPNDRTRQVVEMLRERPMALPDVLERMGLFHPLQFGGQSLIKEEVIGRAALTPTDLLHLNGTFTLWNSEAAEICASLICGLKGWEIEGLIERVMSTVTERIILEVVTFLTGHSLERMPAYVSYDNLGAWLFEESLYGNHPYLGSTISLKIPIIGIGAPAKIFLPQVAEQLRTELIIPQHYEVANAVGAVAASVMVSQEAWIFPQLRGLNVVGYYAKAGGERKRFSKLEEAITFARRTVEGLVRSEAKSNGAVDPHIEFEQLADGVDSYRLRATAIGNPHLGG